MQMRGIGTPAASRKIGKRTLGFLIENSYAAECEILNTLFCIHYVGNCEGIEMPALKKIIW